MTNNDELALKLKAAAEKALPAIEKYEAGEIDGDDALEMLSDFTDVIKPANILALLAERDADKAENELLRQQVAYLEESKANLATLYDMNLCDMLPGPQYMDPPDGGQVEPLEQVARMVEDYRLRISEMEARTVSVKLPKPHAHLIWIQAGHGPDDYWDDVAVSHSLKDRCCDGSERYPVYSIFEIQDACAAAGIKLEVGE